MIDLRSDTVTTPSAEMRQRIATAEVADDVLGKDPTVGALEERVAGLLGKEAALFVPSGTLANQICVRRHCPAGSEIVLDRGSHILNYEAGAAAALSGVGFYSLQGKRGILEPSEVQRAIRPVDRYLPRTSLVLVENSHNTAGGSVWPLDQLEEVARVAHAADVPVHLDGARIWNAAAASGESPARIATCADSVAVSLSKGLGAPVGALLAGSREFIDGCWVIRRQLGGAMRQSGLLAAAGLYALDHNLPRLAADHANARALAERLASIPGVDVDRAATQTNIVFFEIQGTGRDALEVTTECEKRGVAICPFGPTLLRAVTHLDVDEAAITRAGAVFEDVLAGSRAKRPSPDVGS